MSKYRIKIKLLSDMCVSDGGVYNSSLDTEVCFDRYGIPYIPAKRIKGCLRECGVELNDWGKDIDIKAIFGDKGEYANAGALRLGNAYPDNRKSLIDEIVSGNAPVIYHQRNVLDMFSYIRTQTSIDYETGVASEGSLRTMRVIKKGLAFTAEAELDERYATQLKMCTDILTHMGISRTRGFGEVALELEKCDEEQIMHIGQRIEISEQASALKYRIYLKEPVICKSINGGESRTLDYIEGSKILGLIIGQLKEKGVSYDMFMSDELICSNGYIADDKGRYTEVPAYIYSIKNESSGYYDMLSGNEHPVDEQGNEKQISRMKHCYTILAKNGELFKRSVETEERYHHRRPENKGIGRAANEASGDSMLYRMSSISGDQSFEGYIFGTKEQINKIAGILNNGGDYRLGYSSSAEYGSVRLYLEEFQNAGNSIESCDRLCVKLNSPAIIYGDNAFYSTSKKDLEDEIITALGLERELIADTEIYAGYTFAGGYNVTWNKRKPVVSAFDKGSAVIITLKRPISLSMGHICFIGERNSEGYGEVAVYKAGAAKDASYTVTDAGACEEIKEILNVSDRELAKGICDKLFSEYLEMKAIDAAKGSGLCSESVRPTISNMLLMCNECLTVDEVCAGVKARFEKTSENKREKGENARKILSLADAYGRITDEFEAAYGISGYKESVDTDAMKLKYLKELLLQLKYLIRTKKGGAGNE